MVQTVLSVIACVDKTFVLLFTDVTPGVLVSLRPHIDLWLHPFLPNSTWMYHERWEEHGLDVESTAFDVEIYINTARICGYGTEG